MHVYVCVFLYVYVNESVVSVAALSCTGKENLNSKVILHAIYATLTQVVAVQSQLCHSVCVCMCLCMCNSVKVLHVCCR